MANLGFYASVNHSFNNIGIGIATIVGAAILIGIWRLVVKFFRKALKTLDDNTDAIRELKNEMTHLKNDITKWHDIELRVLALEKWRIEVEVVLSRSQ